MISRITRILILIQIVLAAGVAALFVKLAALDNIWLALLCGVSAVVLLRLAITTNNFLLARRNRSPLPAERRLSWGQAGRLVLGEFAATMWSSSWTMPFRRLDKYLADRTDALPVLLVHGYSCNSGYWRSMGHRLGQAGITHYAIDMEPIFGTIDAYAALIHRTVEAICAETGQRKIIIVAHSMGGLAARAYLRDHGAAHVARVITLGTPHHGTALANFSIGVNGQQMRWQRDASSGTASDWLRKLQQSEDAATRALFVSIYSHHDNIIAPQRSSHFPDAKNIELHGIGHVALALNRRVQDIVIDEIRLASQATEDTASRQASREN